MYVCLFGVILSGFERLIWLGEWVGKWGLDDFYGVFFLFLLCMEMLGLVLVDC